MSQNTQDLKQGDVPSGIGGKATNLYRLKEMGIPVPNWVVIPQNTLLEQLPDELIASEDAEKITAFIATLSVDETTLANLLAELTDIDENTFFAVRSSAIDEDGSDFSFAGQYETFLYVRRNEIAEKVNLIWQSAFSARVLTYRKENGLAQQAGIGVIIQKMIDPDTAGVAFGIDPTNGDTDTRIISAVYGLGEGLVSGELDADTFRVKGKNIETTLANKTHHFSQGENGGTVILDVEEKLQNEATLSDSQLFELSALLERLQEKLGKPQDIEFAYVGEKLYLLQTRPVTAAGNVSQGEYILWDNSNIIESYPGITTPLTFSFIIKVYEAVYKQFVGIMGVSDQEIEKHSEVFANTLGFVRGRTYYNLLAWYKMLAMLPGYSINAEYMENMMGVKERFELGDEFKMTKGKAKRRIAAMLFKMIWMQWRLPAKRRWFLKELEGTIAHYKSVDLSTKNAKELIELYTVFEQTLLKKWRAPLINDFFAMIWFGVLQKLTKKYEISENPNIHNDLLCGSSDIISVEPIHRSIALATKISADSEAKAFFETNKQQAIWDALVAGQFPAIKADFDAYIERFGERCVGELKLETVSYSQQPALFVRVIKSYVEQGITASKTGSNIETELRDNAQKQVKKALKGKLFKRIFFNYALRKARDLVSNRENLRYERTRGFGMVRMMLSQLGVNYQENGLIENDRDIFYLELQEIIDHVNGSFDGDIKSIISERKAEFAGFKEQENPSERFYTYGYNFTDAYIYSDEKIEAVEGDLQGIGCCPGRVQAKVRVVMDPTEIESLNGDILVTSSTDPGWVTLFPTASAIIVERGSLLSHSAIVSREMGIPCIVSVTGLLSTLKSGDEVLMDGSTGLIKILEKNG
jgi:phosphohistidine swiveling domain-containing protein